MSILDILESIKRNKESQIIEKLGWDELPKGWTRKSLEKYAKSLTKKNPEEESWFYTCRDKLKSHFGEEGANKMCASLRDSLLKTTMWRSPTYKKEKS